MGTSINTLFERIAALRGTRNLAVYRILSRFLRSVRLALHLKLCIYRNAHKQKTHAIKRPKNLNLLTIRLPINAIVSIMHRMSGVILFLVQPLLLWALATSLHSAEGYGAVTMLMQHWLIKLLLIALSWAFFHHFYAGLRHLAMDVHWMTSLQKARLSSRLVLCLAAVSVAIFAITIW